MKITISKLLRQLNEDLWAGVELRDPGFKPLFDIEEATVEATVAVEVDGEASAGFKIYVVDVGMKAKGKVQHTHKVVLKLRRRVQNNRYPMTSQDDPTACGAEAPE